MADNEIRQYSALPDKSKIDKYDYSNTLTAEALKIGLLSEDEVNRIRSSLLDSFAYVINLYTKDESTSVRNDAARKIMLSMMFNIDTYLRSLKDDLKAIEELKRGAFRDYYASGYMINKKAHEEAMVLLSKVRLTRPHKASDAYIRAVDVNIRNYLTAFNPEFGAQEKLYISLPEFRVRGAFHIGQTVNILKRMLEANEGKKADIVIDSAKGAE